MRKFVILILLMPFVCHAQIYKEHDKQAHFFAGMVISQSVHHIVLERTGSKKKANICAIAAPILIGTLKECIDYANPKKKNFDCRDILATSLGCCVVIPLNIKIKKHEKIHKTDAI